MIIYGHNNSRSTRVTWVAEELGLEYEFRSIDLKTGEARQPAYLAINPGGKVPALVDGDLVLTESAAICNYLASRKPDSGLLPADGTAARALCDRWSYFAMTELEPPLWTITRHSLIYPEARRVPAIIDCAVWEFGRAVSLLEKALQAHGKPYIVGDQFTVADVLIAHCLSWAKAFNVPMESEVVMAYAKALWQRPALKKAREVELAGEPH